MQEGQLRYIDRPWDGSKSRWSTVDDLYACVPAGMQRRAKRLAAAAKREMSKEDCSCMYKEPKSHDTNVRGIASALGRLDSPSSL